jgi:hypothetical protein
MPRNALAFQIPLNDEPEITIIPDDPDAFDLDDCSIYAEREDDITDLIEEEFCFVGPIHAHAYLNGASYCHKCGAAHPSIRRNGCGQI